MEDKLVREWFNNPPERTGTHAIKWDKNLRKFGRADLIPLWIADMDFLSPPAVQQALVERAQHGIYGYTYRTEVYIQSIQNWLSRRYDWQVKKSDLLFFPPGTVAALNTIVKTLTEPGDEIVVQTPSYPPLINMVVKNNRQLIDNPLKLTETGYEMDLQHLESVISNKTRLLLLCSPHNPSGRVWTKEELTHLAQICQSNDIIVVSDEVHADLIFSDAKHTHFNRLEKSKRPESVTVFSSCKTFNLAGLSQSTIICDSIALKRKLQKQIDNSQINLDNIFSAIATQSAYEHGDEWLEELLTYIRANRNWLEGYLAENLKMIKLVPAQGTYLAWLDFSALGKTNKEIQELLVHSAGVGLYSGRDFGENGEGFFRVNLACPRATLEKAFKAIQTTLS